MSLNWGSPFIILLRMPLQEQETQKISEVLFLHPVFVIKNSSKVSPNLFGGKIFMLINAQKLLEKIWKFETQIDIEIQGHQFLNCSETRSSKHGSVLKI